MSRIWVFVGAIVAGLSARMIASAVVVAWLKKKDPSYKPPGIPGYFLMSYWPIARYSQLRRERGESTSVATVFWISGAVGLLALIGLFASLY
jgi:hypothetical protein